MNKKSLYIGTAAVLLLVLAGCGSKPTAAPAATSSASSGAQGSMNGTEPTAASTAAPTPAPTEAPATEQPAVSDKTTRTISVYFTDPEQLDLVQAEAEISYANENDKYTEAFKELQSSGNDQQVPLWSKIELLSLTFTDGAMVLDIHKPAEAQLGAGGESLAISALLQTLFQFDEVVSIDVLVDGEQAESLMGHVDLLHPFTRDNSGL